MLRVAKRPRVLPATLQSLPSTTISHMLGFCNFYAMRAWRCVCRASRNDKAACAQASIGSVEEAKLYDPGSVRKVHSFGHKATLSIDALEYVVANFTRLKELNFLSEQGSLAALSGCANLEAVDFDTFSGTEKEDFADLRTLPSLRSLKIETVDDKGLSHIVALPKLRTLWLRECDQVSEAAFSGLSGLTKLTELHLSDAPALSCLGFVRCLPQLQRLELCFCPKFTGSELAHLAPLAALRSLRLDGMVNLDVDELARLSTLCSLQSLVLSQCPLTDASLVHVGALSQLRELEVSVCEEVTDAGLAHLSGLNVKKLNIDELPEITDQGFAHVAQIKSLEHLSMRWCGITDDGVGHILALPNLKTVKAGFCMALTVVGHRALRSAEIELEVFN